MRDQIAELARAVTREPSRLLGTLFGVVIGASAIVFLGSALTTAGEMLLRTSQRASGEDVTRARRQPSPPSSLGRLVPELSVRDSRPLAEHAGVPLDQMSPTSVLFDQEGTHAGKTMPIGVQSGGTKYAQIMGLELLHGRWLRPEEDGQRLCMVGYDVFQTLLGGAWPLKDPGIVVNTRTRFHVVGVFKRRPPFGGGGGGNGTWLIDRKLFLSIPTFSLTMNSDRTADLIVMKHPVVDGKPTDLKAVAAGLIPYLENLHGGVRNFSFDALDKDFQLSGLVISAVGVILYLCGLIAMLVGGINVMNAQLVTVAERTVEFGIRRALGLSKRALLRQVLVESTVYTLLGSSVGVLLGIGGAKGLSVLLESLGIMWPFRLATGSVIAAFVSALAVGLIAGAWPAKRASAIEPSECLRSS